MKPEVRSQKLDPVVKIPFEVGQKLPLTRGERFGLLDLFPFPKEVKRHADRN